MLGNEEDVGLRVAQVGATQFVDRLAVLVGHEAHGDQAALARRIVFAQARLRDLAGTRGEHEVLRHLVVRDRQPGLTRLVGRELQQVRHMLPHRLA